MRVKRGICVECGAEKWLANNSKKLCYYHNQLRKQKEKKEKQLSKQQYEPLKDFYKRIWASRPHISFLTGESLETTHKSLWLNMFCHVLAKGRAMYPKFKHYEKNIILLSPYEHWLLDKGSAEDRALYQQRKLEQGIPCDWNKIYELKEELKAEYASRFAPHKFGEEK